MDVKELLSKYEGLRCELEEAKKKPAILAEKNRAANKRYDELKNLIYNAESRKDRALINFAAGDISEDELEKARKSLDGLRKEKLDIEEFMNASEKANLQIQKTISDLSVKLHGCKHEFWNAVAGELKSKINSDVIAKVGSVYAARSLAGGVGSYEGFLRQLFPMPPIDEAQSLQRELAEEYGFRD